MQGFNMGRYVPPEHEGLRSANSLAGKNALGSRARKQNQGILTVRFEMPFPIWCTTCPKPTIIGQGVRFNAEKKKVGNYHTTPIFSFRMKHVACGGTLEIRTDPQNTAYVVTEGAKKRDLGEGKLLEGEIRVTSTEAEKERLESDAFAKLEGKVEDRSRAKDEKRRIEELYRAEGRDWEDPGEANRRLRRAFRVERKVREKKAGISEVLRDRMGLGIELLEETEEDGRRAGFVDFGELGGEGAVVKAQSRPLFGEAKVEKKPLAKRVKLMSLTAAAEERREKLRKELGNNTRAVLDPFLGNAKPNTSRTTIAKRKEAPGKNLESPKRIDTRGNNAIPLVDYDSD